MNISLCLLVWNELQGCQIDVPMLPRDDFFEIYAVDGGSTDGTVEYLKSQGIPVYLQPSPGLNAAYVCANQLAKGDAVIAFFPKGTTPPKDVLKFRQSFERGYQLVVASRQVPGGINEEDAHLFKPRKWLVLGLSLAASIMWRRDGNRILDVLHGFKGWTRSAFERMDILNTGLSIDIEMVVRSYKFRIPRVEFPTTELPRQYGSTHFKIWPTGKMLLKYLLFELRRQN